MKLKLTALACTLAVCSASATSTAESQAGEQENSNALLAQPIADTASKLERELPNGFLWTDRSSSNSVIYVVKHGFKDQAQAIVGNGFEVTESAGLTRRELDEYRHNLFQAIDKHVGDVDGLSVSVDPKTLAAQVTGRSMLLNRSIGFDASSTEDVVRAIIVEARDQAHVRLGVNTTRQVNDIVNLTLDPSELSRAMNFDVPTDRSYQNGQQPLMHNRLRD